MKVIKSNIRDAETLRERFLPDMQNAGLFIPKAQGLSVGEAVCLWVQLKSHTAELHVYGTVFWMRHRSGRHKTRLRTGAGIGFRNGQEEQIEFMQRVLAGNASPFPVRRSRRTPLLNPWRCEVRGNGDQTMRPAMLSNISKGGAQCVVGNDAVVSGTQVVLQLPWHSEMPHVMDVAWTRQSDSRSIVGLARNRDGQNSDRDWNDLVTRARRLFTSQVWTRTSIPPPPSPS